MPVRIPAWQAERPLYGALDNAHQQRGEQPAIFGQLAQKINWKQRT
jgi:hypothetical protein